MHGKKCNRCKKPIKPKEEENGKYIKFDLKNNLLCSDCAEKFNIWFNMPKQYRSRGAGAF